MKTTLQLSGDSASSQGSNCTRAGGVDDMPEASSTSVNNREDKSGLSKKRKCPPISAAPSQKLCTWDPTHNTTNKVPFTEDKQTDGLYMRWHYEKWIPPSIIRHPFDRKAWKHFDRLPPQTIPYYGGQPQGYTPMSEPSQPFQVMPTSGVHAYRLQSAHPSSPFVNLTHHPESVDALSDSPSPRMSRKRLQDDGSALSTPDFSATQGPLQGNLQPGDRDIYQRLFIVPEGSGFNPTKVTKEICDVLRTMYTKPWNSWSEIPFDVRQRMLDEFKKKCTWDPVHDKKICTNFGKKAGARLADLFYKSRRKVIKPKWVSDEMWAELLKYWESEEFLKRSAQTKAARNFGKGGSLHCGGAVSFGTKKRELEKKLGRPPNVDEVFKATHTRKKKNKADPDVWVEPRAEYTYIQYQEVMSNRPTPITPEESQELWLQAIGMPRRGQTYGIAYERSFHRFQSGLRGIGSSANAEGIDQERIAQMAKQTAELNNLLAAMRARDDAINVRLSKLEQLIVGFGRQGNSQALRLTQQPMERKNDDDDDDDDSGGEDSADLGQD